MVIKTKFKFGDSVYVKNDPAQLEYILIGVIQRPGAMSYELSYLGEVIEVYEFEVSDTKDILKSLDLGTNEES